MKRKDFDRLAVRRFFKRALRQGTWPLLQRLIVYPSVLRLPPVRLGSNPEFGVHVVVGERHVLMAHWMLRTLHHFAGVLLDVAIHADRTLTADSAKQFETSFQGIRVIRWEESRERMCSLLREYPRLGAWSRGSAWALKGLDAYLLGSSRFVVIIDADVLFFGTPAALFSRAPGAVWMRDGNYALDLAAEAGRDVFGLQPFLQLNAGCGRIERSAFDLGLAEEVLTRVGDPVGDQIIHAAMTARLSDGALLPEYEYNYVKEPGLEGRIARHYTTPYRFLFVEEGVPRTARCLGLALHPILRERP